MDQSTKSIAEFAIRLDYADLPAEVVHDCKQRIIDTIGFAIAAFDEEPARIARAVAMRTQVLNGASVIGAPHRTLPELAAFANSVANRHLEGNDTYPGGGGYRTTICCRFLRSRKRVARARKQRSPPSCSPTRSTATCSSRSRCVSTRSTMCSTTRSPAPPARSRCWD